MITFVPNFAGACRSPSAANLSSSFVGAPVCATPSKATPARVRPRRAVVVSEYNYNIYQDSKDRSMRTLNGNERAVSVAKPLGIVLEEGQDGMVFVASIDPKGNAASTDNIHEGDVVVAVSATFGDEVWSTRGVGLDRVMKSIRVRSGDYVTLVLETPDELSLRKQSSAEEAEARRKMARDTRGEREVLNPVTWSASKQSTSSSDNSVYEYGDPEQAQIDEKLRQKLKNEVAAPYEQNWILWISGGIFFLVIISFVAGLR